MTRLTVSSLILLSLLSCIYPKHILTNRSYKEGKEVLDKREKAYLLVNVKNLNCGKVLVPPIEKYSLGKLNNTLELDFKHIKNESEYELNANEFEKLVTLNFVCDNKSKRTYFLEALSIIGLTGIWGMLIPTPNWGQYLLTTDLIISDKSKKIKKLKYEVESDYSAIYYSLFDSDYKKRGFQKAFDSTFEMITSDFVLNDLEKVDLQSEPKKKILEEKKLHIIQRTNSSFENHLAVEFRKVTGRTTATAFYTDENNNETIGAEGVGTQEEYKINASYYTDRTRLYITPEGGYFYRSVQLKDFGYDVSDFNWGREGFIRGETTNPETGEIIDISSLSYNATFHSIYAGAKAGFNMGFGTESVHHNVNLYYQQNILEVRRTKVDNGVEAFTQYDIPFFSWDPFFSSSTIGLEYSLMIPYIRSGFKAGFDTTFYRKFTFERPIEFRENYYDEELNIYRQKRIYSSYSDLESVLFYLTVYYLF